MSIMALLACKTGSTPQQGRPEATRLEGGRATSPNRRTSDERPRPWIDEKSPFDTDRIGLDAARMRRQTDKNTLPKPKQPSTIPSGAVKAPHPSGPDAAH